MYCKVNSGKTIEAECYVNAIMDIIGKIKPEYLKRIYKFVIYPEFPKISGSTLTPKKL